MNETANEYLWQGYELLSRGDLARAEGLYRQALQIDPDNVDAIVGVMRCLEAQGKYHELVGWRDKVASSPAHHVASAHELIGTACVEIGYYEEGAEHFRRAMELEPDNVSHAWYYAWCLSQRENWEELETVLPSLLARFPEDPFLLYHYGLLFIAKNDYEEALSALEKAASLKASYEIYYSLAWVLGKMGRWAEAKETLLKALEGEVPADAIPTLYYSLGHYALYGNDLEEALSALEKAASLKASYEIYYSLAWVLGKMGRWAEAKQTLLKALEGEVPAEDIPNLYYRLGIYAIRSGELESAEAFLNTALQSSPKRSVYFDAYRALLTIYRRQRQIKRMFLTYFRLLREVLSRRPPYQEE